MSDDPYNKQDRGGADEYAAYFAGMDRSAQQKVALTTAHFPPAGTVADMGCGSGRTTYDLASLYDALELIGIDVNPTTVDWARDHHRRANLRFLPGDIADPLLPDGSLAGILDSSVLHHVTSFNGFSNARVHDLLDNQVRELSTGGVLIIRDFVIPDGPDTIVLDLVEGAGASDVDAPPAEQNVATLFRRFCRDFRSSLNRDGPVPFETLDAPPGHARFRLSLRAATEFVLRKDYRDHWETELLEEYTYFTQREFEASFRKRGLRITVSAPLWNPWIVSHRFVDKFRFESLDGRPLPYPPTNYLIVGEKVAPGGGVALSERAHRVVERPDFLGFERHRHDDGSIWELASRPNPTLDVLPWFEERGRLFVLAKRGFPRPLTTATTDDPPLDGLHAAGYVTEPIAAIAKAGESQNALIERTLQERAGLGPERIRSISSPAHYYPSPGGLSERVSAVHVEIDGWHGEHVIENYSAFTSSGSVRELDATQVLRASHVGGMVDARLELNIYRLLREKRRALGPWIGAEIKPTATTALTPASAATVLTSGQRKAFTPQPSAPGRFLEIRKGTFEERDAAGTVISTADFEYVVPSTRSHQTISILPMTLHEARPHVGLEVRDLPAVQVHEGTSRIVTLPAWRLPKGLGTLEMAEKLAASALTAQFGVSAHRLVQLGGRYFPSAGVTPEVMFPYVAEVEAAGSDLTWVAVDDLLANVERIVDAHLLISLQRLAHALSIPVPSRPFA